MRKESQNFDLHFSLQGLGRSDGGRRHCPMGRDTSKSKVSIYLFYYAEKELALLKARILLLFIFLFNEDFGKINIFKTFN